MEDFDQSPDPALPVTPVKGRGAAENVAHRFSSIERCQESDGWWRDDPLPVRTELLVDHSKQIITRNDSPDIDFDQSINVYRGCEHGCIYCYARPGHAWLGMSPGLDFETRILHKPNAARLLREELSRPGYRCSPIALGAATDAYQPFERKLGLTRSLLEVFVETGHPVSVVTKSALIVRDLDLWRRLAEKNLAHVAVSVTTLDHALSRRLEPRASAPQARLEAIEQLAGVGVPVSVFVAPLIPALNDQELETILLAARPRRPGAGAARYTPLRLPHEVAGLFQRWLEWHAPEKTARVMAILFDLRGGRINDSRFGSRMVGLGHYADLIRQRFLLACRRNGLATEWPTLDCSGFQAPVPEAAPQQLPLF